MPDWMSYKLESSLPGEIPTASDIPILMGESKEDLKSLLMKVKEESERAGLNLSIKNLKSRHPVPSLHGK